MRAEIQLDEPMPHQQRMSREEAEERAKAHEWKPPGKAKHLPHPTTDHYGNGRQEEAAVAMLQQETDCVRAGYKFQAFDYLWRMGHKGTLEDALQDARKLEHWAMRLREHQEHLLDVEAKHQNT